MGFNHLLSGHTASKSQEKGTEELRKKSSIGREEVMCACTEPPLGHTMGKAGMLTPQQILLGAGIVALSWAFPTITVELSDAWIPVVKDYYYHYY